MTTADPLADARTDPLREVLPCNCGVDLYAPGTEALHLRDCPARHRDTFSAYVAAVEDRARAQVAAVEALHTDGVHKCTDGGWWTTDPNYQGAIATVGLCPTLAALADPDAALAHDRAQARRQELLYAADALDRRARWSKAAAKRVWHSSNYTDRIGMRFLACQSGTLERAAARLRARADAIEAQP